MVYKGRIGFPFQNFFFLQNLFLQCWTRLVVRGNKKIISTHRPDGFHNSLWQKTKLWSKTILNIENRPWMFEISFWQIKKLIQINFVTNKDIYLVSLQCCIIMDVCAKSKGLRYTLGKVICEEALAAQ